MEYETPNHLDQAIEAFNTLTSDQLRELKRIARHASIFRRHHSYINNHILDIMYDYNLFTSTSLGNFECRLGKNISKQEIQSLNKGQTLTLITEALAHQEEHGADYWLEKGVTGKLFNHLVELKTN